MKRTEICHIAVNRINSATLTNVRLAVGDVQRHQTVTVLPHLWPASQARGPGFDRAQIHVGVGFVVDKVVLVRDLLPVLLFSADPGSRAI